MYMYMYVWNVKSLVMVFSNNTHTHTHTQCSQVNPTDAATFGHAFTVLTSERSHILVIIINIISYINYIHVYVALICNVR